MVKEADNNNLLRTVSQSCSMPVSVVFVLLQCFFLLRLPLHRIRGGPICIQRKSFEQTKEANGWVKFSLSRGMYIVLPFSPFSSFTKLIR